MACSNFSQVCMGNLDAAKPPKRRIWYFNLGLLEFVMLDCMCQPILRDL
jgi:hypothetical protein